MNVRYILIFICVAFFAQKLYALPLYDEYSGAEGDVESNISHNYSLFAADELGGTNLYDDIMRHIQSPFYTYRRGVKWWHYDRIYNLSNIVNKSITQATQYGEAKIFSSNSLYRVGVSAQYSSPLDRGWGVEGSVDGRTGRDGYIEGVFKQSVSPSFRLTKFFDESHHITLLADIPYTERGLRSSATNECFDLTHNNLYNPSWGFYRGEVRNSRVQRNFLPTLFGRYQRPVSDATIGAFTLDMEFGKRRISSLGWYNSSNPMPNYYYKLPSYFYGSTTYDTILDSWQFNDTDYTQIGWDRLEIANLTSQDGSSYYVVEDQVVRPLEVYVNLLFQTSIDNHFSVDYGAQYTYSSQRKYKQMRDLLGGDYLLDIDQYASDYSHDGNDLQNDLRNPNRKIHEGDRFGYDFAQRSRTIEFAASMNYSSRSVTARVGATLGNKIITRHGYYEKERFPGDGSYGDSQGVEFSTYKFSGDVRYMIDNQNSVSLSGVLSSQPPIAKYLFVAEQNSNQIVDSPTCENIASATLAYQYTSSILSVSAQAYIIAVSDLGQVGEGYDDLSSTYCNYVVSDIATRSIGVEIAARAKFSYRVEVTSTISIVGAEYISTPLVKLYDECDMSLIAESKSTATKGCVVGNTPQIDGQLGATLYARKGIILNANVGYYALRYASPSIRRRTDRIVGSVTSAELESQILTQERLDDMVNVSLSAYKSFDVGRGKISIFVKGDNLLGCSDIVSYATEGNRILSGYYSYSAQESSYLYCTGRKYYISLKYSF